MKSILDFNRARQEGRPIVMVTAYDAPSARVVAASEADVILVGDSVAMTVHGLPSTIHATLAMMELHTAAVRRGAPDMLIVADLPFLTFRRGREAAVDAAGALLRAGATAVKLEGVTGHEDVIAHLAGSGIPVMGHLGLTPQSVNQLGGYRLQGRSEGDAARLQALMAAGLVRASAVAITYLDVAASLKVLANVRGHAPQVPVVVRTQDDVHLDRLQEAGATEIVPEAIEGSLMLAGHLLALVGVPMRRVIRTLQDQRDARYQLLRGYFHGSDDGNASDRDLARLTSVTLAHGDGAIGQSLAALALHATGARVVSLRRSSGHVGAPDEAVQLAEGDTLVLSGHPSALALAQDKLVQG